MNNRGEATTGVKFFLALIFIIGIGINIFVVLDAEKLHWLILPDKEKIGGGGNPPPPELNNFVADARKSILFIQVYGQDNKLACVGTGFIIKPGYVATNAHVITCKQTNVAKFRLKDHTGGEHVAKIAGVSSQRGNAEDLAVLRIVDTSLPTLKLTDSAEYEVRAGDEVFTVGYPLPGIASSVDMASMSNVGRISQFSNEKDMFIVNGMQPNAGNSGGPVFVLAEGKLAGVLGIVVSGVRGNVPGVGEVAGVEYVIPINRMKNFFRMKIGENLE